MKRTWDQEEAKLAEVVEEAIRSGPQMITKLGAEVAIVLSLPESTSSRDRQTNLAQFFRESPLAGSGLDLRRDRRRS